MGYKVNESHLAYRLNYHYAMYKGYPIYLMAEGGSPGYDREDRSYTMQAYKVGEASPSKFHVDVEEPTFSAAATQAGYCFDGSGRLGYISCNCGSLTTMWSSSPSDFSLPCYNSKKLYDCLMGKHPTFADALKAVSAMPRKKACSFDRHFALVRESAFDDIAVHYKGKTIGYYDVKNLRLKLRSGPTVKLLKRKLEKLME